MDQFWLIPSQTAMFWTNNIPHFDQKVSTKSHCGIFRTDEACKPLMKCKFWPVQNTVEQEIFATGNFLDFLPEAIRVQENFANPWLEEFH